MTPKEKRIIERDLETLFSTKAFILPATIEVWKSLDFFHPQVRTENGALPLSSAGIAALRRVTGIIQKLPELRDSCSPKEIAVAVHESYEGWLKRLLQPDGQEFVDGVRDDLLATVKVHVFWPAWKDSIWKTWTGWTSDARRSTKQTRHCSVKSSSVGR